MFEVKNISIKVKDRYLIQNLSFSLNMGDKMAIIGEEGNGKSTLLKSMLGICEYAEVTGHVVFGGNRIGYLEQMMSAENLGKTVYEFLFQNEFDYYEKVTKLYQYLEWVHLNDAIMKRTISTLSGGEKVKIGILRLLIGEYDILFLDEPTNDLDIETLEWLEQFINQIPHPVIYISHDETLLSKTANMILHLEQIKKKSDCRYTLYKIDYDSYVEMRLRNIDKQTREAKSEKRKFEKQQEKLNRIMQKVEHQQNTISRKDPHGAKLLKKKMHSLKSQEKKLDRTELLEIPDVEEHISFYFENVEIPKTKKIMSVNIKELKVQENIVSKNIVFDIFGNTHLCIIGKNGVGKSVLIKQIYECLKNRTDIKVGYMPQNYNDVLGHYEYVLDFLCPNRDQVQITKARTYLGNMKFTREEMIGKIEELSNGTKAKLILIKLVLDNCNVLILDEPTRNVSPLSNPVIRNVLRNYKGTIISVSHDRKYIDEVIDCLYMLTPNSFTRER